MSFEEGACGIPDGPALVHFDSSALICACNVFGSKRRKVYSGGGVGPTYSVDVPNYSWLIPYYIF